MKKIFHTVTMAAVLTAATSCEHKDLCYDHSHTVDVKVAFDWENAPGAAPASMSFYLFPAGGGEALRYDFTDCTGGTIRVPVGSYEALCLNSDTENINYRNTECRETFEVATRTTSLLGSLSGLGVRSEGVPRPEGTESELVVLCPDMLWSDHAEGVVLTRLSTTQTITLYPQQSVSRYTVEIRNAENLKYVSGISGSLSSMAESLYPGVGCDATCERCVTVPFEVDISADKAAVTGGLFAFGCPSARKTHTLTVYAVLSDESKWYYTYDVTDQIHSAPNQRDVHIVLDGLPLPKPIVNGGGFQPDVDEWQSEEIEIPM